jgi:hypothetical protein
MISADLSRSEEGSEAVGSPTGASAILVVAHPGHELLLHRWMEVAKPLVFALTDGSGSGAVGRSDQSKVIIEATGASIGPVFGPHPDKFWYAAILEGNIAPFAQVIDAIAASCRANPLVLVVSDPVEYFNPVHDLCSAVASRVVACMPSDARPRHLEYAIEQTGLEEPAQQVLRLDASALERKTCAATRYAGLEPELACVRARSSGWRGDLERLFPAMEGAMWPATLSTPPFYESYGRARIEAGAYGRLITYADHVRPLAMRIVERYC